MSLSLGLRTSGSRPRFSAKQGKPQARQQLQSSGLIVEEASNRFAFPLAFSGFSRARFSLPFVRGRSPV